MMAIGVLGFAIAILVSVMLHEAGHFVTARLFGMKATQFFVGFGPTLWSRRKGETEYGVKAIPAGGFVKIIGMTPLEDVAPEDRPRAFINKPGWQRFIVLVAGSTMHFVIALVLLFAFALAWPSKDTGNAKIAAVFTCAVPSSTGNCAPGAVAAPAYGVLEKGDVIVAVNGRQVKTAVVPNPDAVGQTVKGGTTAAIAMIKASHGALTLSIERHGTLQTVHITPVVVNGAPKIGFQAADSLARLGPIAAAGQAASLFGQGVVGSFTALGKVPQEVGNLFSTHTVKRTTDNGGGTVTSVVGVARFAGQGFSSGGFGSGLALLIGIVASVNLFIGIFNLFPFLPLDGGHVAILAYEKTRDAVRRRQHKPAAGPVDLNKLMPITYTFLVIIVGISAMILFADVVNPVANPFKQ